MFSKNFKSFAAHYALLPNGDLGKWPIITVDESGVIIQLELRESFKERPGLEMHPGILLPGFVDVYERNSHTEVIAPNFNRHFAHGTILLGSSFLQQLKSFPRLTSPASNYHKCVDFLIRDSKEDLSLFTRMKEYHQHFPAQKLSDILFCATQEGASKTEFGHQVGQLKEGFKPGVMVLQKVDLNVMQLTADAQVKWLSLPIYE